MEEMGKTMREGDKKITPMTSAVPTFSHMVLVALQNKGILKYLISQNCDGLHLKSGILPSNISELHGNANLEYCEFCYTQYLRDYDASTVSLTTHKTGRKCVKEGCSGDLRDTIINFGEFLDPDIVKRANEHVKLTDVMVVIGSSLTVGSASCYPLSVVKDKKKGKKTLIIINRQPTPLDKYATLKIGASIDDVFRIVVRELELEVPSFIIDRYLTITHQEIEKGIRSITIGGTDARGLHNSFIQGVVVTIPDIKENSNNTEPNISQVIIQNNTSDVPLIASPSAPAPPPPPMPKTTTKTPTLSKLAPPKSRKIILTHEPFNFEIPKSIPLDQVLIKIRFMGHYGEPLIKFSLNKEILSQMNCSIHLKYNPQSSIWNMVTPLNFTITQEYLNCK